MTTAVEITMPVQFKVWADDSAAFSMHRVRRLQYLRESLSEMLDRLSRRARAYRHRHHAHSSDPFPFHIEPHRYGVLSVPR